MGIAEVEAHDANGREPKSPQTIREPPGNQQYIQRDKGIDRIHVGHIRAGRSTNESSHLCNLSHNSRKTFRNTGPGRVKKTLGSTIFLCYRERPFGRLHV